MFLPTVKVLGGQFESGLKDPDGEIDKSVKKHGKSRIPNFCYIQVIVFDLSYLSVAAVGT